MQEVKQLLSLMEHLRDPHAGCPWDQAQTYASIAPYTIEEAYEVAEAIARGDRTALKQELGDLLFQVVFHAQLAKEEGAFTFAEVAAAVTEKMIRRHPHVFGETRYADRAEQSHAWERLKAAERDTPADSVLDGVPPALPAMVRATKLQRKAAQVGFDWTAPMAVLEKITEELTELRNELEADAAPARLTEELGDILFACVNLARHLAVEPESALRLANLKFERRFQRIETWLKAAGRSFQQAGSAELEALWERAKAEERGE